MDLNFVGIRCMADRTRPVVPNRTWHAGLRLIAIHRKKFSRAMKFETRPALNGIVLKL
jgi:hypothetical protein